MAAVSKVQNTVVSAPRVPHTLAHRPCLYPEYLHPASPASALPSLQALSTANTGCRFPPPAFVSPVLPACAFPTSSCLLKTVPAPPPRTGLPAPGLHPPACPQAAGLSTRPRPGFTAYRLVSVHSAPTGLEGPALSPLQVDSASRGSIHLWALCRGTTSVELHCQPGRGLAEMESYNFSSRE